VWFLRVPLRAGGTVRKTTGTSLGEVAKAIEGLVIGLADHQRWELLEAVTGANATRSLMDLYAMSKAGTLDAFEKKLNQPDSETTDPNIEPLVANWFAALTSGTETSRRRKKVSPDTADHYHHAVRLFIPEGTAFARSRLTVSALQTWVDNMDDAEPATVRKRGMGARRFCAWLVTREVLEVNPMDRVELPTQGKPRCHFLDTPEAIALAEKQDRPYRELSALLAGTGIEVSVALALTRRDVNTDTRMIRAAGTKTHCRDRVVRVADWAWPYVERLCKNKLPGARLFEAVPHRWRAREVHDEARDALAKENALYVGYTMRDARHTWAVRSARSGWPLEAISRQLGHANTVLVASVYGRFVPRHEELARWEALATARDAEEIKAREREAREAATG
jgi:integrase